MSAADVILMFKYPAACGGDFYYRCRSAQVEIVRVLHGSREMGSILNQSK